LGSAEPRLKNTALGKSRPSVETAGFMSYCLLLKSYTKYNIKEKLKYI